MDLNALDIASMAGHIMLENGAEISRVEEVMERIASSFGADSRKFFVLSNGIFTTGKGYANVEFIPIHGSQLDKVIEVNQMSRDIEAGMYTIEEAYEKLKQINSAPPRMGATFGLGTRFGSFLRHIWRRTGRLRSFARVGSASVDFRAICQYAVLL